METIKKEIIENQFSGINVKINLVELDSDIIYQFVGGLSGKNLFKIVKLFKKEVWQEGHLYEYTKENDFSKLYNEMTKELGLPDYKYVYESEYNNNNMYERVVFVYMDNERFTDKIFTQDVFSEYLIIGDDYREYQGIKHLKSIR